MQQQQIKVLVVDDEPYSRDELTYILQSYPSIQIVGEADSGENAILKSIQLLPDVIFLDIEMPKQNGMKTAEALKKLKKVPLIVFATAYPQFAVEAFRHNAIDYILKPFDEEQIMETVKRLEDKLLITKDEPFRKLEGKIAVDYDGEICYIDPTQILYIFRDKKVTIIVTKDNEYETKTPLKEFENRLLDFHFFRIHKSFLVNLTYVTKLTPWFNGAYELKLEGVEKNLPVSRNYAKALRERMEL